MIDTRMIRKDGHQYVQIIKDGRLIDEAARRQIRHGDDGRGRARDRRLLIMERRHVAAVRFRNDVRISRTAKGREHLFA